MPQGCQWLCMNYYCAVPLLRNSTQHGFLEQAREFKSSRELPSHEGWWTSWHFLGQSQVDRCELWSVLPYVLPCIIFPTPYCHFLGWPKTCQVCDNIIYLYCHVYPSLSWDFHTCRSALLQSMPKGLKWYSPSLAALLQASRASFESLKIVFVAVSEVSRRCCILIARQG